MHASLYPKLLLKSPERKRHRKLDIILQSRDYAVFLLFQYVRLIRAADIYALLAKHFESKFVLWRRLSRMESKGYLVCPPAQRWRPRSRRGNLERIYAQGNRCAKVRAKDLGHKLSKNDWDQKAKAFKPFSLEHPIWVARAFVCFFLGIEETEGLRLVELYPEGKFLDHVTFFDGAADVTLPIKPDYLFVVESTRGETPERLGLVIEVQRGATPYTRPTFLLTSYYKKSLAYLHYWADKWHFQERLDVDDIIILTLFDQENTKQDSLIDVIKDLDRENMKKERRGSDVFWFAPLNALDLSNPSKLLVEEIWTTAAGKKGSLF